MEMTLRMPNRYVEIDRDEMEYVDGGIGVDTTGYWTNNKSGTVTIPAWLTGTIVSMGVAVGSVYLSAVIVSLGAKSALAIANVIINRGASLLFKDIRIEYGTSTYYDRSIKRFTWTIPYAKIV